MQACGGFSILHHRAATRGVDGYDGGFKRVNRLHCLGNRIGNVVQFKVEENGKAQLLHFMHAMVAIGAEKFETKLYPANLSLDTACQFQRVFEIGRVDGDEDRVGHIVSTAV